MSNHPRIKPIGLLTLAMALAFALSASVGCDNQDPGQPPVRSISAPAHKGTVIPPAAAEKAKKAPAHR